MNIQSLASRSIFFAAAALVGAAAAAFITPAEAQRTGPYQLVAHSNETADVGIFRLDQSSGRVSFCSVLAGATPTVYCTQEAE